MSKGKCWSSRKRKQLWTANPHCHWCGCVTVLERSSGKSVPDNLATIDHLRPRYFADRQERCEPGERRLVLACNWCNCNRDRAYRLAMGKEWLWKENGQYPITHRPDDYVVEARRVLLGKMERVKTRPDAEQILPKMQIGLAKLDAELEKRGIGEVISESASVVLAVDPSWFTPNQNTSAK